LIEVDVEFTSISKFSRVKDSETYL